MEGNASIAQKSSNVARWCFEVFLMLLFMGISADYTVTILLFPTAPIFMSGLAIAVTVNSGKWSSDKKDFRKALFLNICSLVVCVASFFTSLRWLQKFKDIDL